MWQQHCQSAYQPRQQCFAIRDELTDLPGLLAERKPASHTLAYVCQGTSCQAPVTELAQLSDEPLTEVTG